MKPIQQLKYPDGYDIVEIGPSEEDEKKFKVAQTSVIDDILEKINELVNRVNKLG